MGAAALWLACCGAAAAQGFDTVAASFPALEVNAHGSPRLHETQPALRVEAVRWQRRGANAFGVALGAHVAPPAPDLASARTHAGVGIGLRWRSELGDRQRLDVAAWRPLADDEHDSGVLTTRIEMQFTSPRSALADHGALGLQLSGDSRVAMRLRRGGPMVYYRSRF